VTAALTPRIVAFVESIGISVCVGDVPDDSFMPGVTVQDGGIVFNPGRLSHPGDLLHETGHIAVADPATRATLCTVSSDPGEEMAAIAWSYAALAAIGIDPAVVFHADGYQGGSDAIIANFGNGQYFGVPLLQWFGMVDADPADARRSCYPVMRRWLR